MDQFVYLPCATPALPKGISVSPRLLLAMGVLGGGVKRKKLWICSFLFSCMCQTGPNTEQHPEFLPLVAALTALWGYDMLQGWCSLILGPAGAETSHFEGYRALYRNGERCNRNAHAAPRQWKKGAVQQGDPSYSMGYFKWAMRGVQRRQAPFHEICPSCFLW